MFLLFATIITSKLYIDTHNEKEFLNWMKETNNFFVGEEYYFRFGIWLSNKRLIHEHNAAKKGFTLSLNHISHLTNAEYRALMNSDMHYTPKYTYRKSAPRTDIKAPDSFDWRDKGVVPPVKNMGYCNAAWAFCTTFLQGVQWAIIYRTSYDLSEQNLLDCVDSCSGCIGGYITNAIDYIISEQNGHFMSEDDYSYQGEIDACQYNESKGLTEITGYFTSQNDEEDIMNKVAGYGCAACTIDTSPVTFYLYNSGIYDDPTCESVHPNSLAEVVGYGYQGDQHYWIIRLTIGSSWGMGGYMYIAKDKNMCGIANEAVFVQVN